MEIKLSEINFLAVLVAAIAAFIASGVWYGLFSKPLAKLSPATTGDNMPAWKIGSEIIRSFFVALVLSYVVVIVGIANWRGAALIGILLWFGFPLIILLGSVIHEKVPWKLAAIHIGDWLVKLLLMAVILGLWR